MTITLLLTAILLVPQLVASLASAEDSAMRTELHNRSLLNGLGRPSVQLLKRSPGPGSETTAVALLERFQGSKSKRFSLQGSVLKTEEDGPNVTVGGVRGWYVYVKGDGSGAKVGNYEHLSVAPRVRPEERPTLAELEMLGRQFIAEELEGFVRLAPGDELVPLSTQYQVDEVGEGEEILSEEVSAAVIVFGRRVDGVAVLGPGSKIAVTFAMDGTPVAFSYDWPDYVSLGRVQPVLGIDQIRERASAMASMRFGSESVETRRFECGYIDSGGQRARRDVEAPVQAGCWVNYVGSRRDPTYAREEEDDPLYGVERAGVADAIPAGNAVERDRGWPQVVSLQQAGDICAVSELTEAIIPDSIKGDIK